MPVISPILLFFAENFSHVNLIIEQGNTSSKVAVYNGRHMEASFVYKKFDVDELESLFGKYDFKHGILSTVIGRNEELNDYLRGKLQRFIFLDETIRLPISVQYETPETLGKDRLAAAVGANYLRTDRSFRHLSGGEYLSGYDYAFQSFEFLYKKTTFGDGTGGDPFIGNKY